MAGAHPSASPPRRQLNRLYLTTEARLIQAGMPEIASETLERDVG
jgi:hypothetical protein